MNFAGILSLSASIFHLLGVILSSIQVGIPSDREQYIHRLGRTGREGKEGVGILLLAPWEKYFLDEVKDLPIDRIPVPSVEPDVKVKVFIYSILP